MDIRDLVRLRKAKDRMDREFDRPLDVPALARSAAMSTGHFSRSFKAAFGESPYSYLMTRRIERAKALLRRSDMSVTDACFAVGFTSLGSFSSRFTEVVGESPSRYRRPQPRRAARHVHLPDDDTDPAAQGRGPEAVGNKQFRRSRPLLHGVASAP